MSNMRLRMVKFLSLKSIHVRHELFHLSQRLSGYQLRKLQLELWRVKKLSDFDLELKNLKTCSRKGSSFFHFQDFQMLTRYLDLKCAQLVKLWVWIGHLKRLLQSHKWLLELRFQKRALFFVSMRDTDKPKIIESVQVSGANRI